MSVTLLRLLTAFCSCTPICVAITIEGHIWGGGAPLEGAVVSVAGNLGKFDAISDTEGRFRLPLVDGVEAGQEVRIYVARAGYAVFDKSVLLAQAQVMTVDIRLTPARSAPPGLAIDDVFFPYSADPSKKKVELLISNRGSSPIVIRRINMVGELVRGYAGLTGFLQELEYEIHIDGIANGQLQATGGPPNTDSPYEIKGSYSHWADTRRRDQLGWKMSLSCPIGLHVDAHDTFRLNLTLQKGLMAELSRHVEGEMSAATVMRTIRENLTLILVSDSGVVEKTIKSTELLKWVGDLTLKSDKTEGPK